MGYLATWVPGCVGVGVLTALLRMATAGKQGFATHSSLIGNWTLEIGHLNLKQMNAIQSER
jgi:hypothetical protein